MKLVGMLDSPFVRRLAITMRMLGIEHEHHSQSVVAGYETFKTINPLAKAPTLMLDDGEMMIESSLIISHVEALAGRSLMPDGIDAQRRALQIIGVALLSMDKVVAHIYETEMRPEEFQYGPWLDRVHEQIRTSFAWLEQAVVAIDDGPWLFGKTMTQADITTAVAWRFAQLRTPALARDDAFPALAVFSARADLLVHTIQPWPVLVVGWPHLCLVDVGHNLVHGQKCNADDLQRSPLRIDPVGHQRAAGKRLDMADNQR